MEWWSLLQNEWVKFRGRRRHWIALGGVVVLAGMAAMVMGSPSPGFRSSHIAADRLEIRSMVGELRTARGSARTWDYAQLLVARYDLAALTHKPLPPLEPIVRATGALARAENRGNRANFTAALDEWQQSRYALAHNLPIAPSWVPPTGLIDVNQVFAGNGVALFAVLAVLLTSDVLGMESGTQTWNRVWLDPPPRGRVLLAKAALATAVAAGTMCVAAVVLYAAAALRNGAGPDWVTVETHRRAVSAYSAYLHQHYTYYTATKISDAAGISLVASDVWAVLGSLPALAAVVGVAACLGYFISQPTVATLLAAGFAVTPILMETGSAPPPVLAPGTYLDMGRVAAGGSSIDGSASVLGASVGLGLLVSVVWLAVAWGSVAWHQRRAEL